MVVFRSPRRRLGKASFAKGLERSDHQLSADPLAPSRWIAIELIEFAHRDGVVGVVVSRRSNDSEADHPPFPFGDEQVLA
jgi:hypothetical protein